MSTRASRATPATKQGSETAALRWLIWHADQPHPFARLLMLEQLGIPDRKRVTLTQEPFRRWTQMPRAAPPTVCAKGHDLTVMGRLRTYRYSYGTRYACLACIGDRNRARLERTAHLSKEAVCKVCGKAFQTKHRAVVCGGPCTNRYMAKQVKAGMKHVATEAWSQMNAAALLELHAQRDRCATHWERAEVDALIEAKKREML